VSDVPDNSGISRPRPGHQTQPVKHLGPAPRPRRPTCFRPRRAGHTVNKTMRSVAACRRTSLARLVLHGCAVQVCICGDQTSRNLLDWLPDIQTTSLVHRGVSEGRRCRPSLARPRNRAGIAASEQRFTEAPRKELDRPLTLRGAALVHLSRPPGPSSRVAAVTLQPDLRDRPTRVLGSMASKLHKAVSHVSTAALSPRAGV